MLQHSAESTNLVQYNRTNIYGEHFNFFIVLFFFILFPCVSSKAQRTDDSWDAFKAPLTMMIFFFKHLKHMPLMFSL